MFGDAEAPAAMRGPIAPEMHSGMNAVAKVRFEFGMVYEGLGSEIGIACNIEAAVERGITARAGRKNNGDDISETKRITKTLLNMSDE